MLLVRRLIETPVCRRYVQIDLHDFMMDEREMAAKYGVPWDRARPQSAVASGATVASAVFACVCLLVACAGKGA